jgi:deoxyribodipyrimidine photolyase-related protein
MRSKPAEATSPARPSRRDPDVDDRHGHAAGAASASVPTVWVLGDQLNRVRGALAGRMPGECRVLLVESETLVSSRLWHRHRLHLVLSAMMHFAEELRLEGFEVDHRRARTLGQGLRDHVDEFGTRRVIAMEPTSWDARVLLERLGVELARNDLFLCHYDEFAVWAASRKRLTMEDFYRWQRQRLGVLIDHGIGALEPVGGRWNFDHDNREPPPRDGRAWPSIEHFELDDIDRGVLDRLPTSTVGADPDGTWPVTRTQALIRLQEFVDRGLALFGPHEDAMLAAEWKLAHSVLSSSMNLGLLHPAEVVAAAEAAYWRGDAPLNSVEGFIRQVIGWREYVWGVYWEWMPAYRTSNAFRATRQVPPVFTGRARTEMACVASVINHVHDHGFAHHIERLMVLGNLALTAGVDPGAMTAWMQASFVDGAEWVMLPNVIGMALFADGGKMATKPYASGGAYINKMSDSCRTCRFDPKQRVGPTACPYTTLYWDFLARNADALATNHRMARPLAAMRRLSDLPEVRSRAIEILDRLDRGEL